MSFQQARDWCHLQNNALWRIQQQPLMKGIKRIRPDIDP